MKPSLNTIESLAKSRLTGKVRLTNNVKLIKGMKANHDSIAGGVDYLQKGLKLSTAAGGLLDAKGEFYDTPRAGLGDDEYRAKLQTLSAGLTTSMQSRPAIGNYLFSLYAVTWLKPGGVNLPDGAKGAALNRAPLGRMIYVECDGVAPNIQLPESLVSATFSGDAYSTATPPNVKLTDNSPLMPGNIFPAVWGGLEYLRTERAIKGGAGVAIRVSPGKGIYTRLQTNEIVSPEGVSPKNTMPVHQSIEVVNG